MTATWSRRIVATAGQRLLLACGVIGPLLFNVVYLIEGASRPGYDAGRELERLATGVASLLTVLIALRLLAGTGRVSSEQESEMSR